MKKMKEMLAILAGQGSIIVFFIMAFEVMIMISPFAFFFYSVFNPIFHWLDVFSATRWLTSFFLPHMVLPSTLVLKAIRISGSLLFVIGFFTFIICAAQVYLGKIFKWGVANKGLYHYIRHPQYLSLGIWGMGMAILWPRFIVLATLSIMFILYYYLARDEEKRMLFQYSDSYHNYMSKTGMFLPAIIEKRIVSPSKYIRSNLLKTAFIYVSIPLVVITAGLICRYITLNSLELKTKGNITLVSVMPEDNKLTQKIIDAITVDTIDFIKKEKDYLGYQMPVDYVMQGMIANTGTEHHLYKQHHTIALIADWVLHPFEHLRRPPSVQMAEMNNVDPDKARRHHCPINVNDKDIECSNCSYRRIIFVEIGHGLNGHITGKNLFAFNITRVPAGYIDVNSLTGQIISAKTVEADTAWKDVPTPAL